MRKGLGFHNRRSLSGFSPGSLFAAGEQGVWYDPSDLATLYQDSAGTTPVTAIEQPVGLMLDKSKGLVLGPELNTDPTFSGGFWSSNPNITVGSGKVSYTSTPVANALFKSALLTSGKTYRITLTIANYVSGAVSVETPSPQSAVFSGNGTFSCTVASVGSTVFYLTARNATTTLDVTSISIKEVPGNHATQSTSTKRPLLSARVNLLTKTEDLNDAAWTTKTNIAITTGVSDPNSGNTAFTVTASGGAGRLLQQTAYAYSANGTASLWVRRRTGTGAINWETPTVGVGPAISVTSDWQLFTYTTSTVGGFWYYGFRIATIGDAIDVWHPDLRVTNTGVGLPVYQYVNTSTDYATAGFPLFLRADGVDDGLVTNSIDFTATDKMTVWAGVRKLSDATDVILVELSANVSSNNGSFYASAPESAASLSYSFLSHGSSAINANQRASTPLATYPAPITNVLAFTGDISGDLNTIRVNQVAGTNATGDQGSGNYGNYPLYVGARAGTSLYFNGNLYSLIIRGAQCTASQISATESWVNGKTYAY